MSLPVTAEWCQHHVGGVQGVDVVWWHTTLLSSDVGRPGEIGSVNLLDGLQVCQHLRGEPLHWIEYNIILCKCNVHQNHSHRNNSLPLTHTANLSYRDNCFCRYVYNEHFLWCWFKAHYNIIISVCNNLCMCIYCITGKFCGLWMIKLIVKPLNLWNMSTNLWCVL